ncbi:MAG: dihydrofolate reductase family protein [Candidatus Limnocylindrales bacterium]
MGKVIFLMNVSLDGYIETPDHSLDWTIVDDKLHSWFNERERSLDALVYGRRLYELMNAYWPTAEAKPEMTDTEIEYARIWNAQPKVVVSRTLQAAPAGWRLTSGDPETILEELRRDFSGDLGIGGPTLAAGFIRRGLVDEYGLVVHPVILGGGTPFFPDLERPAGLRLLETRTFSSGVVYLGFAAR